MYVYVWMWRNIYHNVECHNSPSVCPLTWCSTKGHRVYFRMDFGNDSQRPLLWNPGTVKHC